MWNFREFDEARDRGNALGYNTINPADIDREVWGRDPLASEEDRLACEKIWDEGGEEELIECVIRDAAAILSLRKSKGDRIALLDEWEGSTGAVAEFFLARFAGLPVISAKTLEPLTQEEIDRIDFQKIAMSARLYLEGFVK